MYIHIYTHTYIHTYTHIYMHVHFRVMNRAWSMYRTSIPENFTMDEGKDWVPAVKAKNIKRRMEDVLASAEEGMYVYVCVYVCMYVCI